MTPQLEVVAMEMEAPVLLPMSDGTSAGANESLAPEANPEDLFDFNVIAGE